MESTSKHCWKLFDELVMILDVGELETLRRACNPPFPLRPGSFIQLCSTHRLHRWTSGRAPCPTHSGSHAWRRKALTHRRADKSGLGGAWFANWSCFLSRELSVESHRGPGTFKGVTFFAPATPLEGLEVRVCTL